MSCRRRQLLLLGLLQPLGDHQTGAIQQGPDLLQLLDFTAVMLACEATAPKTNPVESHPPRMPLHQAVRGHITLDAGHTTDHGHPANVDKLVDPETATDHRPVLDGHVPGHLDGIGHHDSIPNSQL